MGRHPYRAHRPNSGVEYGNTGIVRHDGAHAGATTGIGALSGGVTIDSARRHDRDCVHYVACLDAMIRDRRRCNGSHVCPPGCPRFVAVVTRADGAP